MPGLIGPRLLITAATVLHPDRVTNARAAGAAGPGRLNMSHTPNTNLIHEIHEAWATANGYRIKRQASSAKLLKHQAASPKPHTQSFKLQAASDKLHDPRTTIHLNKFRGPRTMALGYDESVVRMCFMEGDLVRRKFKFIPSSDFQFNSEKCARSIITQ